MSEQKDANKNVPVAKKATPPVVKKDTPPAVRAETPPAVKKETLPAETTRPKPSGGDSAKGAPSRPRGKRPPKKGRRPEERLDIPKMEKAPNPSLGEMLSEEMKKKLDALKKGKK